MGVGGSTEVQTSMRRNLILGAIATALAACGTAPVSTAEAIDVPKSRVIDSSLLNPRAGSVPIVIKRDSGLVGSACNAKVFVDGALIAELATSEKVTVHLGRGQHMLGAQHNCLRNLAEAPLNLEDGKPRTFRIGTGANGDFSLQQTAF